MNIIGRIACKIIGIRSPHYLLHQQDVRISELAARLETLSTPVPCVEALLDGNSTDVRHWVAKSYIKGNGIEIGAFTSPLKVPAAAHVSYVDKFTVEEVKKHFDISGLTMKDFGVDENLIVNLDIVDDGETLAKLGDNTQDFVIANHVLEHFEDPIKGFKNMLRVVKHSGFIYLSLPEMRRCFDRTRDPTTFEHILRDYEEGPEWSRDLAYREFGRIFVSEGMDKGLFGKTHGSARQEFENQQAKTLQEAGFSIHFHAWTMDTMMEMFLEMKERFNLPFDVKLALQNDYEVIFVFQKNVPTVRRAGSAE